MKPPLPSVKGKRAVRKPAPRAPRKVARGAPQLDVSFVSIEVLHNGWPAPDKRTTDLSIVLQIENPGAPSENRVLATARLPFRAQPGDTIAKAQLSPVDSGSPFFKGPVAVSDHVNLHVRYFIERSNAVGPILGAALNTVVGEVTDRIPLLPEPLREALHIQIGKTIATELARATVIIPVEPSMEGKHPVTVALISPRTIPGFYAPPGSPVGYKKGIVATEGDLAALLHLELDLKLT
ncbi:MAG: hypothetical protein ABIT01_10880 [Thermoanaerobaculia bacterium]